MKILNLYFKNINSLEGESRVQFDRPPIANCGVFVITGPNGSGKSSLLDVITLGLYGETSRFDRPVEHVMTKSTAESFAQIEFELEGHKYRSIWQVKRQGGKQTGDLLPAEMKLFQLNKDEVMLEDDTQKVREKIIELIGMDFHSFTKSMVLAQGDFAAFLNALDSERMDVLEKISGTDIYTRHKQEVEAKHTDAQSVLQQLEQELNAIPVIDTVARETGEHDIADFNEQLIELNQDQTMVQEQLDWFQSVTDLENQGKSLVRQKQKDEAQLEQNNKSLEQIESSQGVIELDTDVVLVDEKTEVVQQSEKVLQSFRHELELLQSQLKSQNFDKDNVLPITTPSEQKSRIGEIQAKLGTLGADLSREQNLAQSLNQQLEDKKASLQVTEIWLKEHETDQKLLTDFPEIDKLKALRVELVDLSKEQKKSAKWIKSTTSDIKNKKSELSSLTQKISQAKSDVEASEKALALILDGRIAEALQSLQVEQTERISHFQELFDLANVNAKLGKKGFFSQLMKSKGTKAEVVELKKEADLLQLKIGKEQNLVLVLETALKNEALLKKMAVDRVHLVDRKACPLCGASEHPYEKYPPAVSNSRKVLAEQEKKIKSLVAESKNVAKQITTAELQSAKDSKKDSQLKLVRAQWRTLANKLNTASIEMDDLSLMKEFVAREKKELININKMLKKQREQQDNIAQLKLMIETSEVSLKRVTEESAELDKQWKNRPQESIDVEQLYTQCVANEKELSEKITQQLTELGEKMPPKRKEENFLISLKNRQQEYQSQVTRQAPLIEAITLLNEKIKVCADKVNRLNQDIAERSDSMQKEELAGLHLSLVEKQKLIAEKEVVFSQQSAELTSLKKVVLQKTKGTVAGDQALDIDRLKAMIVLAKKQPEIQQQKIDISQNISDVTTKIEQVQLQVETEKAKTLSTHSDKELLEQRKSIKNKIEMAQQEVNSLQKKFAKQDDLKDKHETVLKQVAKQQKIVATCEEDVKEQENGLDFRHKIQQGLVDQLLSQSNQVLEKISGRYYLRKADSEHGLAIEIEDTKQQNSRRLPKTLSGGESFVVSLALALGLADIATKGHAVDTLFLDEGFGNLDEESLYLVMTTLEGLRSHGKLVGVISHVEGVRKRIKTQIEMVKKPNGFSALKVIS